MRVRLAIETLIRSRWSAFRVCNGGVKRGGERRTGRGRGGREEGRKGRDRVWGKSQVVEVDVVSN